MNGLGPQPRAHRWAKEARGEVNHECYTEVFDDRLTFFFFFSFTIDVSQFADSWSIRDSLKSRVEIRGDLRRGGRKREVTSEDGRRRISYGSVTCHVWESRMQIVGIRLHFPTGRCALVHSQFGAAFMFVWSHTQMRSKWWMDTGRMTHEQISQQLMLLGKHSRLGWNSNTRTTASTSNPS